tara:strand:- start:286 stop:501 length:216 start_codon:yes stop_codon:yes gene_type:complete
MPGWLISIHLLEDRFIFILLGLFKLGIVRTKEDGFSGFSLVIGFWRFEAQLNLSIVSDIKIKLNDYEAGRA